MSIRLMQRELEQWGAWARTTEKTLGLKQYESPTYTMLRQNVHQGYRAGTVILLDDDALGAIDQLVQMLKQSRPDLYSAVHLHYLNGYSVAMIANRAGEARYKIDSMLLSAETWLDCKLEDLCARAA